MREPIEAAQLLERYKPALRYDSYERSLAIPPAEWVGSEQSVLLDGDGAIIAEHPVLSLDFLGASTYPDGRPAGGDHSVGPRPGSEEEFATRSRHEGVIPARVVTDRDGRTWLQYLYLFLESDSSASRGWSAGVWRVVQLRLAEPGLPDTLVCGEVYSAVVAPWTSAETVGESSDAPVIYVARESHGLYLTAGQHVTGREVHVTDGERPGPPVTLSDVSVDPPAWLEWPGHWGHRSETEGVQLVQPSPGLMAWWRDPRALMDAAEGAKRGAALGAEHTTFELEPSLVEGGIAFDYAFERADRDVPESLRVTVQTEDGSVIADRRMVIEEPAGRLEIPLEPMPDDAIGVSVAELARVLGSATATLVLEREGILVGRAGGALNDRVAPEDKLGFKSYVEAFADLIESPHTSPPVTIGIFGSWGMGKSFLLQHIRDELVGRYEERRRYGRVDGEHWRRVHCVEFNAWEYSANDVVWPGLVRKVMDRIEEEAGGNRFVRFWNRFRRNLKREWRRQGRVMLAAGVSALALAAAFGLAAATDAADEVTGVLTGIGVAGGALTFIALLRPLSRWLVSVFQGEDYGRQMGLMETIKEDLEYLGRRLEADEARILITIDDLDRCEPDKSVEVLQAINLLLGFPSFIVCLGIDARVITAAVERHYSDLLESSGASGYEYLDKVVQIPFRIPRPGPSDLVRLIGYQMGDPAPPTTRGPREPAADEEKRPAEPEFESDPSDEGSRLAKRLVRRPLPRPGLATDVTPQAEARAAGVGFTHHELMAFERFAEHMRANPRHVKRLVNIYRLVRSLAERRGEQRILDNPAATVRWLIVSAQWPYTTYMMLREFREGARLDKEGDPLAALHVRVKGKLDPRLASGLDYDDEVLEDLLAERTIGFDRDYLATVEPYTINFNPAVEVAAAATQPERG